MIPNIENIQRYTFKDYEEWGDDFKCELIDGYIYMMSSPSTLHQYLSKVIFRQFDRYVENKNCEVFYAPLDVRLFPEEDKSDNTIVQPDLMVICDRTRWNPNYTCYLGPPELIIEIISPSTKIKDFYDKKARYFLSGVKEYWVVFNESRIQVNVLGDRDDGYASIDYFSRYNIIEVPVRLPDWDLTVTINQNEIPDDYRT